MEHCNPTRTPAQTSLFPQLMSAPTERTFSARTRSYRRWATRPNATATPIGPTTTHYNSSFPSFYDAWSSGPRLYNFAKSTDTNSDDSDGGFSFTGLGAVNVAGDFGPSDFDVRNSFSAAVSCQIPSPHWERVIDAILRNWYIDGIVRISSAAPYEAFFFNPRPNIVPGLPFYLPAPGEPGGRTLNPAAFTPAPAGQQGDLPRPITSADSPSTRPIFRCAASFISTSARACSSVLSTSISLTTPCLPLTSSPASGRPHKRSTSCSVH